MTKTVALQGIAGSYHDIAARNFFDDEDIDVLGCETFKAVIAALQDRPDRLGIMAIENTIAGSLLDNHELIRKSGLAVIGECKLRISHCLAALPGTSFDDLREIGSHPMALLQCDVFLETLPGVRVVARDDTASSARRIAEDGLRGHAAICSRQAAEHYGLEILASEIETDKHNSTRFLILVDPESPEKTLRDLLRPIDKASLVFTLPHSIGSLSQVLAVLSFYGMNLTKIQSFPVVGEEWQYRFYIDLTFVDYRRYRNSLAAVRPLTRDLQVLGEYGSDCQGTTCQSTTRKRVLVINSSPKRQRGV